MTLRSELLRPHQRFGELLLEQVADALAHLSRLNLVLEGDDYLFLHEDETICRISKEELGKTLSQLEAVSIYDGVNLSDELSLEVPVNAHSFMIGREVSEIHQVSDRENGLSYKLGKPSERFILFTALEIKKLDMPRGGFRSIGPLALRRLRGQYDGPVPLFEYLANSISFYTVTLTSTKRGVKPTTFFSYINSYLFTLGYNLNMSLVAIRNIEEFLRTYRIRRMRRAKPEEITAPRKQYNIDLIQHYQLGISADNPALEYLSFYHVIEHFFDEIFNENTVHVIREKIVSEGFSYKRDKDIREIIELSLKGRKILNDTVKVSESEALRYTLMKFIENPDELDFLIRNYDESLISYYEMNEVSFSKGKKVVFDSRDKFYETVAQRIYSTRNSIVHSKEGEKSRYTPFKDDRILYKEVPLIRFLAEIIINKSAKII